MKKILFWGAAALLAAVSCNKELENTTPVLPEGDRVSFVATVDGAATKTVMGDLANDEVASYWDGTETIWILDPQTDNGVLNEGWKKEFEGTAKMSKTITFVEKNDSPLTGDNYYAIYPGYSETSNNATWNGQDDAMNNVCLKGVQTPVEGSYYAQNHIAVAYTEKGNNNLAFKNVVSFVKVTVGNDDVSSVCVYNNDVNNAMSGVFTVSYNDGNPQVSKKAEAYNNYAKVEGTINNGSTYYIAVLPGTYAGFTLEYVIAGDKYSKTLKNAITIDRNKVINLGEVSFDVDPIEYTEVYMKPSTEWVANDARYAAYTWITDGASAWYDLTDSDSDGVFEAKIPNTFENIIFCLMKADTSNDWSNKIEQTDDLKMPVNDNNAYIVYNKTWTTLAGAKAFIEQPAPEPEPENKLYLKPHEEWFKYGESNNGWFFAAYFFGSGDTWVALSDDDEDGYYECNIPNNKYTKVIFVQMYGNKQLSDEWAAKKNQTVDLTIPTDGKNLFIMDNPWNESQEWKATGAWSTK